jgi:endonuclease YncB( thermonuclease family)
MMLYLQLLLFLLLTVPSAAAQTAPKAKPFESVTGCVLVPDRSNDGDSFVVRFPNGRRDTVRLYYVDAPESETAYRDRLDEQGAYFGITRQQAAQIGNEAAAFTAKALGEPFTVQTRWRLLFGRRMLVMITTNAGEDLGELLVRNGLARIHGVRTPLPDGRTSRQYLAYLRTLEEQAKADRAGGWRLFDNGMRDECGGAGGRRSAHPPRPILNRYSRSEFLWQWAIRARENRHARSSVFRVTIRTIWVRIPS